MERFPWRKERLPTLVFQRGEVHGLYSPRGHKESDTTERVSLSRRESRTEPWGPPILGSQGDEADKARDQDGVARKARSTAGVRSALEAKRRKWFRGESQLLTDVLEDQMRLII